MKRCAKNIQISLGKEWADIRDRIIQGYDDVDFQIVWAVVKSDIPQIKPKIERVIKDYEG